MNCSEFENELAALLTGEAGGLGRERRLSRLREHVAACSECAGSANLVEWASLPVLERDPYDEPGPEYWDGFDARLRERIARNDSAGIIRRRRAWIGLAAAALVGVALIVPWLLRERGPNVTPVPSQTTEQALDAILDGADPDAVRHEIDLAVGVADAWSVPPETGSLLGGDDALIPAVGEMDGPDRRKFLEWLEAETERLEGGSA